MGFGQVHTRPSRYTLEAVTFGPQAHLHSATPRQQPVWFRVLETKVGRVGSQLLPGADSTEPNVNLNSVKGNFRAKSAFAKFISSLTAKFCQWRLK